MRWRERAAPKAHAIPVHLLRELPGTEVHLDERWSFRRRKPAQQAEADGASHAQSEDGWQWVWRSLAPADRRILAAFGGPRTGHSALQRIPMTAAVVLGVPCVGRDGFRCCLAALLEVYHTVQTCPRTGKPGRPTQPVQEPHPALVSGQVSKKKRQGRLQEGIARVGCGAERLEGLGLSLSTSLLARLTLTLRHAWVPLVRTSQSCWKARTPMRRRVVLLQAFYNFARPPMRVRLPLAEQAPRASGVLQPQWQHRPPGMAAGLTDHGWTFRALLTAQCEPIHNQSTSG